MSIKIYGIKNCDTMKKAFAWLDTNNIDYDFHDYKKQGIDEDIIKKAIDAHGWENVLNRRGTTWRQLSDSEKASMNDNLALKIAQKNPSIIKRPLLTFNGTTYLGFKAEQYQEIFSLIPTPLRE